jgi:two-component system LytT family response regulator
MLTAYLVDDENHALNILDLLLQQTGMVDIIGRANNGFEALQAFEQTRPQVWFIDIDMPEMCGIELAQRIAKLDDRAFIVFTTAHDQYAVRAFELDATDYILKPVDYNRIMKTVERITKENALYDTAAKLHQQRLHVQLLGSYQVVNHAGQMIDWRISKEKELFAYMILNSPGAVARDKLIDTIWANESYAKAKVYLHTAISMLRKNLKKLGAEQAITYKMETYRLDLSKIECDVHLLANDLANYRNGKLSPLQMLHAITKHYQGQMLGDEDYPWSVSMMREYEASILAALIKVTHTFIQLGNYEQAMLAAQKASHIAPYEEEAYTLLMQIHIKLGSTQHAIAVYKQLELKLSELNAYPSQQSKNIFHQL